MCKDAAEGYRREGRPSSRQGEVWNEVDRKMLAMGSFSPSRALDQAYEDHKSRLEETIREVRVPEGCSGVVFVFGGRIAGGDLFDKPSTLAKLLPKLAKSYAIDAMESADSTAGVDRTAVIDWLRSAAKARLDRFKSPGLGDDIRIESPQTVGACLRVDERPVHVELFPACV